MPKKQRQATRTTPGFTGPFKGNAQQGTLFDKRTLLNPDQHIGPRGYSPERIRAVRATGIGDRVDTHFEAVGRGGKSNRFEDPHRDPRPGASGVHEDAQGYSERHDTIPELPPDVHRYGPTYMGPEHNNLDELPRSDTYQKSMQRGRARVVEDLARSTIPVEHLAGTPITLRNRLRAAEVGHGNSSGYYKPNTAAGARIGLVGNADRSPTFRETQPQHGPLDTEHTFTLLHELGHHASSTERTEHSQYRTPNQVGQEEAYADTYALQHYRRDRRDRYPDDPADHTYEGMGHHHSFQVGLYQPYRLASDDRPHLPISGHSEQPGLPGMEHPTGPFRKRSSIDEAREAYVKARWDPRNR